MEKLIELLNRIRPDIDFTSETKLIENGVLDSFDIVSILSALDDEFNVSVRINELNPENFNSAESIMDMINRLNNGN